jgi:soluble lytic murein transglycosylase-like protein
MQLLNRRLRPAFTALACLALAALVPSAGAANLYGFEDEDGVAHFGDAASDRRYRLVLPDDRRYRLNLPEGHGYRLVEPNSLRLGPKPAHLTPLIGQAARHARLDPALIEAVVRVESGFDAAARSPKGAQGLMQLMPATARRYGVDDPFNPAQNLLGGARYLRDLIDRFTSLPLALAAYNAGEGAVERYGNAIPPYAETVAYVPRVLDHYHRLKGSGGRP